MEPERLIAGKRFQEEVCADFRRNNQSGTIRVESSRPLDGGRRGRIDVLVDDLGDFVAVYEVKATNWDRIPRQNVRRNARRHQLQLLRYVDAYVDENTDVCLGIIYPAPPSSIELRQELEQFLEEEGTPAYWFNEIRGPVE